MTAVKIVSGYSLALLAILLKRKFSLYIGSAENMILTTLLREKMIILFLNLFIKQRYFYFPSLEKNKKIKKNFIVQNAEKPSCSLTKPKMYDMI